MAWDTKDNDFGAPITLLVLNLINFTFIYSVFYKAKAKVELELFDRIENLHKDVAQNRSTQAKLTGERDDFELLRKGEYEDSFVFQNPSNHHYSEYHPVFINNEIEFDGERLLGTATHICTQDTCTYKRGYTYVDLSLSFTH